MLPLSAIGFLTIGGFLGVTLFTRIPAIVAMVFTAVAAAVLGGFTGHISALTGRIYDANGKRLYSAHSHKSGKRYSYYVSSTRNNRNGWRLPAGDAEALVQQSLAAFLSDPNRLDAELGGLGLTEANTSRAAMLTPPPGDSKGLREMLEQLDGRVLLESHALRIELDRSRLAEAMCIGTTEALLSDPIILTGPVSLKRRGIELRLVYTSPDARPANRDPHLIDLIRRGWAAWIKLTTEQRPSNPVQRSHLVRLARLRFLAPDITIAIIEGRQPIELTARSLLRSGGLPIDWNDQRKALGFA